MPTITKTIKPDGTGDYSTLTDALSSVSTLANDFIFNAYAGDCGTLGGDSITDAFYSFKSLVVNAVERHSGVFLNNPSTVAYIGATVDISTLRPVTFSGFVHGDTVNIFAGSSTTIIDSAVFQCSTTFGLFFANLDQNGDISTVVQNSAFYGSDIRALTSIISGVGRGILTLRNCSGDATVLAQSGGTVASSTTTIVNASNCAFPISAAFFEQGTGGGGLEIETINLINCCYGTKTTSGTNTAPQVSNEVTEFISSTDFHSLNASSKIRDNGTSTGAPSVDIIGVARPQNGSFDIGAFEFLPPPPSVFSISQSGFCIYG